MNGMEAEALGGGSGDLSKMPDHPANIASENYEQEFMLGLLESERVLLDQIDGALQRIEDKIYGVCLGTAKPIGLPRLKARPWSKYCIDYARLVEQGKVGTRRNIIPRYKPQAGHTEFHVIVVKTSLIPGRIVWFPLDHLLVDTLRSLDVFHDVHDM